MSQTHAAPTISTESLLPASQHGRDDALEQACERIVDAGLAGAGWVVFPEGYLPGYPLWVWTVSPGHHPLLDALLAEAIADAVQIPSAVTDRLCRVAQRAQVNVAIGLIERDDDHASATWYNTLLFINTQGQIVGRYRTPCVRGVAGVEWLPTPAMRPPDNTPLLARAGGI
jgi:nitrilase